jgi:RNA polymerase sigma-70 factor, ECF subfamily
MNGSRDATERDDLDALVDLSVDGDTVAIERLIARIHPAVVRYCRTRLVSGHRSIASAEDIAQEVCMAVYTALPTFRQEGRPFLAFVYGICGHKVADAHRMASRSRSLPVAEVPDAPSTDRGPEQFAVAGAVSFSMNELLAQLPDTQQEILRLRVGAGFSADETAQALGMTAGAVRVAQHRGLAKLRHLLAADAALSEQLV